MKTKQIGIILVMLFLEILAIHFFNKSNNTNNRNFLIYGLFIYTALGFFLFKIIQLDQNIIVTNNTWQMLNVITVTIIGLVYYKCKLSKLQIIGVFLALASVLTYSCEDMIK